jgi:hypothetical protein
MRRLRWAHSLPLPGARLLAHGSGLHGEPRARRPFAGYFARSSRIRGLESRRRWDGTARELRSEGPGRFAIELDTDPGARCGACSPRSVAGGQNAWWVQSVVAETPLFLPFPPGTRQFARLEA